MWALQSPPPSAMTLGTWILYLMGSFIRTNGLGKWRELTQFRSNFILLIFPQIWPNSDRLQIICWSRIVMLLRSTLTTPGLCLTSRNCHSTPTTWSRPVTVSAYKYPWKTKARNTANCLSPTPLLRRWRWQSSRSKWMRRITMPLSSQAWSHHWRKSVWVQLEQLGSSPNNPTARRVNQTMLSRSQ